MHIPKITSMWVIYTHENKYLLPSPKFQVAFGFLSQVVLCLQEKSCSKVLLDSTPVQVVGWWTSTACWAILVEGSLNRQTILPRRGQATDHKNHYCCQRQTVLENTQRSETCLRLYKITIKASHSVSERAGEYPAELPRPSKGPSTDRAQGLRRTLGSVAWPNNVAWQPIVHWWGEGRLAEFWDALLSLFFFKDAPLQLNWK